MSRNLGNRFTAAANRLIEAVGVPVEVWAEVYTEATANTSAGYDKPRCVWSGMARLEVANPPRVPGVEATVQGEIPEWIATMSADGFCNLPAKSRWWIVADSKQYTPTRDSYPDAQSGGIVGIGLKGGR
jgi:hypothetical protein